MIASLRRLLRRGERVLVLAPIAAVLATLALALVAAGHRRLAMVAWVLAAALVAARAAGSRRSEGAGYGREVPARLLLLAAAAVEAGRHTPNHRGLVWTVTAVLMIGVLVEPLLLRALVRLRAVHALPGYRLPPGASTVPAFVWVSFGEVVAAGVLALVGAPRALYYALLAVAVLVGAGTAATAVAAWRDRTPRRGRLRRALVDYAPEFILYTGREDGGAYQIAMWLPYLERLGARYLVVVRTQRALDALSSLTAAPIVSRVSLRDLDDVMVDSIKAAFYVNSTANNAHLVTYRAVRHVYLGHGDSDKALSHHPMHAMYDFVFVAGPAAVDRYRRNGVTMRPEAFVVVGRPQLESMHSAQQRAAERGGRRASVLYAPTWFGHNAANTHSSLPEAAALVKELLTADVDVVFRPHPFSRRLPAEHVRAAAVDELLRQDAARTGRAHRFGPTVDGAAFTESANACDVLIADMSSIMVDFLGSDKPMAVNVRGVASPAEFLARYPVAQGAYLVEAGAGHVSAALAAMLGDDPQRAQRRATRDYYLGGFDGAGAVRAFLAAAMRCVRPDPGSKASADPT